MLALFTYLGYLCIVNKTIKQSAVASARKFALVISRLKLFSITNIMIA